MRLNLPVRKSRLFTGNPADAPDNIRQGPLSGTPALGRMRLCPGEEQ
jgi:hypothetical protein